MAKVSIATDLMKLIRHIDEIMQPYYYFLLSNECLLVEYTSYLLSTML